VPPSRRPGVLPMRPLTVGELLDAAVALLREHPAVLLVAGAVVAAGEQLVLWPLRTQAELTAPGFLPHGGQFAAYWPLLAAGLGTEAVAIALLGGLAGRAAGPALLGTRLTGRQLLAVPVGQALSVLAVAVVVGPLVALCALALLVPWLFGYGLTGLAAPAVTIDGYGPGGALVRSVGLSGQAGMRAVRVRTAGYLTWLAIRLLLALGAPGVVSAFFGHPAWLPFAAIAATTAVNAVAYATLACLDAVLLLELRIRTEGLDIWLGRQISRGNPTPSLRVNP
jgi:hypothetical protein